jgi:hypothetical protein
VPGGAAEEPTGGKIVEERGDANRTEAQDQFVHNVKAAVVNSVVDALSHLGVSHLDMPLRPERVWRAVQAASRQ